MMRFIIPKIPKDVTKTIRMNEELAKQIQLIADKENISFNKVVNEMIKFALKHM